MPLQLTEHSARSGHNGQYVPSPVPPSQPLGHRCAAQRAAICEIQRAIHGPVTGSAAGRERASAVTQTAAASRRKGRTTIEDQRLLIIWYSAAIAYE